MANQSQPRPWLRLGSLARPVGPAPGSATGPQMQPPPALLPRPSMLRPTFRPPIASQPGQDVAPPLQPPRPRAPPPLMPSATPSSVPPPLPPPISPPKSLPKIATSPVTPKSRLASPVIQNSPRNASPVIQNSPRNASPVIQNSPRNASPVIQNSPHNASPVIPNSPRDAFSVIQNSPRNAGPVIQNSSRSASLIQNSARNDGPVIQNSPRNAAPVTQKSLPESPVTQKYPYVQRTSPTSSKIPSESPPPSSRKPRNQSSPPSIPSSPAMKQDVAKPMPASSSKLSSPSPKASSPYSMQMVPSARAAKPLPETPPESPKFNLSQHSPPLFSLPYSKLMSDGVYERNIPAISEQKIVRNPYDDESVKPKARVIKTVSDSEDIGRRVITISGENRGAVMELGYPPRAHGNLHKIRSDGELSEANLSGNEGGSKMEGRNPNARAKASTPMHTFMNSNVQGINSSIVFNSTLSHHDPGVHLSLSRNPVKGRLKEHCNGNNIVQKEEG